MSPVKGRFGNSIVLGLFGIGFAGVFCLLIMWLGLIVGNYTGWERFELPPPGAALNGVFVSCAMDFVLNTCNLIAIGFVGPTIFTVGALLLIPLNVLAQFFFFGTLPNAMGWSGITIIVVGCLCFELGDFVYDRYFRQPESNRVKFYTINHEELYQSSAGKDDIVDIVSESETTRLIN